MLLKQTLKLLIDQAGIEAINNAIAEIFDDRYQVAFDHKEKENAEYFDELSHQYDEINRILSVREYRDKRPL